MVRGLLDTRAGRLAAGVLGALAVATAVGLLALWPDGSSQVRPLQIGAQQRAEITAVRASGCRELAGPGCRRLEIELRSGPGEGRSAFLVLEGGPTAPDVERGDAIRVASNAPPEGVPPPPAGAPAPAPYTFVDFERRVPLTVLALLFGALVVALGRWQGLRSLVGVAISLLVIVMFAVPAILEGEAPLLVALVGALAVMFVTIPLTHGLGAKSIAAMLGTVSALVLIALLAVLFVAAANITGFSSEEATLLSAGGASDLSLEGLVLAGIVIGALGVLDDVTVSQASTVLAITRANPGQRYREVVRSAMTVGRDHLGATVNTLVLAYAGAALPILLVFSNQGTGFSDAINSEPVATEAIATLVGSIGLIAAVPLTTALAALLAARLPSGVLAREDVHTH